MWRGDAGPAARRGAAPFTRRREPSVARRASAWRSGRDDAVVGYRRVCCKTRPRSLAARVLPLVSVPQHPRLYPMFPRSPLLDRCRLPRPAFGCPAAHAVSPPTVCLAHFHFPAGPRTARPAGIIPLFTCCGPCAMLACRANTTGGFLMFATESPVWPGTGSVPWGHPHVSRGQSALLRRYGAMSV